MPKLKIDPMLTILFVYLIAYACFGSAFARIGIPLSWFGLSTPSPDARLFSMEILLGIVGIFSLANIINHPRPRLNKSGRLLALSMAALILYSLIRVALEIREDPVLVLRNSAFAWYNIFPLLLALLRWQAWEMEQLLSRFLKAIFIFFSFTTLSKLIFGPVSFLQILWFPEYGFGFILFIALVSKKSRLAIAAIALIGVAFGISLAEKVQRTSALNLIITIPIAFTYLTIRRQTISSFSRLGILAVAVPLGLILYSGSMYLHDRIQSRFWLHMDSYPLIKSVGGRFGIEGFRETMWRDAINIIKDHPWVGVGMRRQVVYRVLYGPNKFLPNNGGFERPGAPSISGPHNSYLNAAARLGTLPALLLILIHSLALVILFRSRYWAGFFCLLGQINYAVFNVGLEGPVRSFGLLVCLALALKISIQAERKKFNRT